MTHLRSPSSNYTPTARQSLEWTTQTTKLLRQLAHTLGTTIEQLKSFQTDSTFTGITGPASRYIPVILATTRELEDNVQTLKFLRQVCHDHNNDVSSFLTRLFGIKLTRMGIWILLYLIHKGTFNPDVQPRSNNLGEIMTIVMLRVRSTQMIMSS